MPENRERRGTVRKKMDKTAVMIAQDFDQKPAWQKNIIFLLGVMLIVGVMVNAMFLHPEAAVDEEGFILHEHTWVEWASHGAVMFIGAFALWPHSMLKILDRVMKWRRKNNG